MRLSKSQEEYSSPSTGALLVGAAVGVGGTLAVLWLLRHGGSAGSGRGSASTGPLVERIQFRITGRGVSYSAHALVNPAEAVAIAQETRPRTIELYATGDAIGDVIRALRDALVAAGFTVTGNPAAADALTRG